MLQKIRPKKDTLPVAKEALEFHPDAEELELTPLPRATRLVLHFILALFAILLLWACFAETDKVIPAQGKIVSSGKNIIVSPLQDAIIRSIDVRLGAVVKKGDVLVQLDPTFAAADASRIQVGATYQKLLIARLESELSGVPLAPPAEATPQEVEAQVKMLDGRMDEFTAKLRSVNTKIAELQQALVAGQRQHVLDGQASAGGPGTGGHAQEGLRAGFRFPPFHA